MPTPGKEELSNGPCDKSNFDEQEYIGPADSGSSGNGSGSPPSYAETLIDVESSGSLKKVTAFSDSPSQNEDNVAWKAASHSSTLLEKDFPRFLDQCEPVAVPSTVQELIERHTKATPNAQALCTTDKTMTYQELHKVAGQVTEALRAMGVDKGHFVPFCLEKSPWAVVAMIAVLNTGAAFVPLDPHYPINRVEEILRDTRAEVVICAKETQDLIHQLNHVTVLTIDDNEDFSAPNKCDEVDPSAVDSETPAYVLFTSGSSGRPKGVVVSHKNICSGMVAQAKMFGIGHQSRVLQFAAFVFDASICEILTTLTHGGCVCIPTEAEKVNDIARFIRRSSVDWALFTPSVIKLIDPVAVPSLRHLVLGGEALESRVIQTWYDRVENMWNAYGPTEGSVVSAATLIRSPDQPANIIGQALGCRGWVVHVEDHNRLCQIESQGELLIEGPIVASGYLNNSLQTDEAFILDPAWAKSLCSTRRMYKTGDIVRQRGDGSFTYVGRKDHQVKVNGQRMELGEIEQALNSNDQVLRAVAVVPFSGPCKQRLATVISLVMSNELREARHETQLETSPMIVTERLDANRAIIQEIEDGLHKLLPKYMIPSLWISVNDLPLLPSGKVDRRRVTEWITNFEEHELGQILGFDQTGDDEVPAITDPITASIRSIWASVLNVHASQVTLDRNFLNLGGDSISAMQVISQCRKQNISVTVQDLLETKTVSGLASKAKPLTTGYAFDSLSKTEQIGEPFALSPVQIMHFDLMPRGEDHYNQSFLLDLQRDVSQERIEEALRAVVQRHSMLRARFCQDPSGTWKQLISTELFSSYSFEVARTTTESSIMDCCEHAQRQLNIRQGPLIAGRFLTSDGENTHLFLCAHHLIIDYVSWRIILRDIEDYICFGTLQGDVPLSFQNWILMETQHAQQELIPSRVLPFKVEIPDFCYWGMNERPNLQKDMIAETFTLDQNTTALILDQANYPLSTRPRELMMAAILFSFCGVFADREVPPLFTEGHGREPWSPEIDVSETVGWFTTIFPIQVGKCTSLLDALRQVKDMQRSLPNKGWAYFSSRYLNAEGITTFQDHGKMEISFDYLGVYQQFERGDSLMRQSPLTDRIRRKADIDGDVPRVSLIEITGSMKDGELTFAFEYNQHMRHQDNIIRWAYECKALLCTGALNLVGIERELTTSDFPRVKLDREELRLLTDQLQPIFKESNYGLDDIDDLYPCSAMQEGMLVSKAKSDKYYNFKWIIELKHLSGKIEFERLQEAWKTVVNRHPILRTIFVEGVNSKNLFLQVVMKTVDARILPLQCQTLQSLKDARKPTHENNLSYTMSYTESPSGGIFLRFDASHAIVDGSTMPLLMEEIHSSYEKRSRPAPGPQFGNFISHLQDRNMDEDILYWSEFLADLEPCEFPNLNEGESTVFRSQEFRLPDKDIRKFCRQHNCTAANLYQLTWAVTLSRYTDLVDVCFGCLASGRDVPVPQAERMVGPLINMMICRLRLDDTSSLLDLLEELREDSTRSLSHQHTSLGKLQQHLGLGGRALFNSVVNVQRLPRCEHQNSDVSVTEVAAEDPSEYKVSLNFEERVETGSVLATISYWTSWLSDGQAANLADTLVQVIESIVANPQQTLSELNVVSEAQRDRFERWNSNPLLTVGSCIHDLVDYQAGVQPDKVAVQSTAYSLTYRELKDLSTRFAIYLVLQGVVQEMIVPYALSKSPHAVVIMLGILKAGGACLALDPSQPQSRLQAIIHEIEGTTVVTQPEHSSLFVEMTTSESESLDIISLHDDFWNELPHASGCATTPTVSPSNRAFITFTSGSTGKPKGIVLQHDTMATSMHYHGAVEQVTEETRAFQFCNFVFDVSIEEIFTTLTFGGRVCMPTEHERMHDLSASIRALEVNWTHLTPTVAGLIDPSDVPGLKYLVLGGEPIPQDLVERWSSVHVTIIATYGPAECSITCAGIEVTPLISNCGLMGKAAGAYLWVVEPTNHDKLIPIGCPGELLIEGPLVGRGYLDAEKTRAAWIYDPMWSSTKSTGQAPCSKTPRRMYKSGDIVRLNSDGSLRSAGRKDNQVKVHGQRVEVDEVERRLLASGGLVRHALVTVPREGPWSQKLVVVLSLRELDAGAKPGKNLQVLHRRHANLVAERISHLRNALEAEVPSYMIPSVWVPVVEVPLNTSGKLFRGQITRWLDEHDASVRDQILSFCIQDDSSSEPANEVETRLRNVWSRVLRIDCQSIGLNQSFLSLGGDSISAMQVISGCKANQLIVTLQDIVRCKTIRQLAFHTKTTESSVYHAKNVQAETLGPFQLTPIQKMYFDIFPTGENHYHQNVLLEVRSQVSAIQIESALMEVIKKHPMLRARFGRKAGSWTQSICGDTKQSLRFDHIKAENLEVTYSTLLESLDSINIQNGPLFAAILVGQSDQLQYLFMVAHHLAVDIVSWRIVFDDLEVLLEGKPIDDEAFTFQSWSRLLSTSSETLRQPRKTLPTQTRDADCEYWGFSKDLGVIGDTSIKSFTLGPKATALLMGNANFPLATEPLEIMIATLAYTFGQTFHDRDVPAIYNESHGRETPDLHVDLSRTVGWFTTMAPIQSCRSEDFIQTLSNIKDTRRRIPNKGSDYFLSRYCTAEGKEVFGGHARMEILFNYIGMYRQPSSTTRLFTELPPDHRLLPSTVAAHVPRAAVFDINACVSGDEFTMSFEYSKKSKHQENICLWIQTCKDTLENALQRLSTMDRLLTPSDFPLASFDNSTLHTLFTEKLSHLGHFEFSNIEDIYPCTPVQEGILVSRMKTKGQYDVDWVGEVKAASVAECVDVSKLYQAWQSVVQRHPILRTVFVEDVTQEGLFLQVVLSQVTANVDLVDVKDPQCLMAQSKNDKDLTCQLPHRVTLRETGNHAILFELEINHAVLDGTTTSILLRDLGLAYCDLLQPGPGPLYKDLVAHLKTLPEHDNLEYWNKLLGSVEPCHFPKLLLEDETPFQEHKTFKHLLTNASSIHKFCAREGLTLSNLFQLAWSVVLRAYTGTEDVCFGYLSSGRDVPLTDIHDAAGPYINMMICRMAIDSKNTVAEALHSAQDQWAESLTHSHTSLAKIHHRLGLGGSKLFNTVLNIQRGTTEDPPARGIVINCVSESDPSEYDISLDVEDCGDAIALVLSFWTACINSEHAENIMGTFSTVIESLISGYQRSLGEIRLCGDAQQKQIEGWNPKHLPLVDACVHDIVSHYCTVSPHAQAISSTQGSFTYQQLDESSTRLAHQLMLLGVGAEVMVPFCFDKSPWTIVAMLAILKAGGAYVALDPEYPEQRRKFIIEAINATLVVCERHHQHLFLNVVERVIAVNEKYITQLPFLSEKSLARIKPSNAAIVAFTSGSTGRPKGIVLEHRNIATNMYTNGELNLVSNKTRSLQFASYTFDLSTNEIFGVLGRGGCVCVPTADERKNDLAGVIGRLDVNWLYITPSVASILNPAEIPQVKTIVLGGEAISKDTVNRWLGYANIVASYGPAEASVACSGTLISSKHIISGMLGTPSGSRLWVVDQNDHNTLLPIGCTGELVIEGPLVARQYLKEPERTAASFITDPAWANPMITDTTALCSRRMYKSGDLARFEVDGMLTYRGRRDDQVKLNGYRIELGEIEHHLSAYSTTKHVAVTIPKIGLWKERLIAVLSLTGLDFVHSDARALQLLTVEPHNIVAELVEGIRNSLSEQIPKYMIPAHFLILRDLPLSTSGKIDRRRVLEWLANMSEHEQQIALCLSGEGPTSQPLEQPRTTMETSLQKIWSKVLGLPAVSIGVNESFLGLGGDSVSAMKIIGQCRLLNIATTVQDVFQCRTIAQLARRCSFKDTPNPHCDKSVTRIPVTAAQHAYLEASVRSGRSECAACHIRLKSHVEEKDIYNAFKNLADMHPMLKTRFERTSGGWMHGIPLQASYCHFQTSEATENDQMDAFYESLSSKIDVLEGPLSAAQLIHARDEDDLLIVIAHKAIVDAHSWQILSDDIKALLEIHTSLPSEGRSFGDWVEDKFQRYSGTDLRKADASQLFEHSLKIDGSDITREMIELDELTTTTLLTKASETLRTKPAEVLAASLVQSFQNVFVRHSSLTLLIEDSERGSAVSDEILARTIGCFTQLSCVLVDFAAPGDNAAMTFLKQIKDSRRVDFSHCGLRLDSDDDERIKNACSKDNLYVLLRYNDVMQDQSLSKPSPDGPSPNVVVVEAQLKDGKMQVSFQYSRQSPYQIELSLWPRLFALIAKQNIVQLANMDPTFSKSDFPLMGFTNETLTQFIDSKLPALGIKAGNVLDMFSCSPTQNGMLLSNAKDGNLYNIEWIEQVIPHSATLPVDPRKLEEAWSQVVQRHQILRTTFIEDPSQLGAFAGLVLRSFMPDVHQVVHMNLAEFETETMSVRFSPGKPPHRVTICTTATGDVYFKLEISHAALDGSSKFILWRELSEAYEGLLPKTNGPLYSDVIAHLQKRSKLKTAQYWADYLEDAKPCLFPNLNGDPTRKNAFRDLKVPLAGSSKIRDFCSKYEVTLAHVIQTAWALALRSYVGLDDVCFGYIASGRDLPLRDIDGIVGPLINMMICRLQLEDGMTLVSLVQAVRDGNVSQLPHQHCSLADVYHDLNLSSKQLFNTTVTVLRDAGDTPEDDTALNFSNVGGSGGGTEFAVVVDVLATDADIEVNLTYSGKSLSRHQAVNLMEVLREAVATLIEDPDRSLRDISLIGPRQSQQLENFNREMPPLVEQSIHDLFKYNNGQAPAICSATGDLSYCQLDAVTSMLASRLISFGVRPGSVVPFLMEKSTSAIVSMIGIMKAGGAFVPLDPSNPVKRTRQILDNFDLCALLTSPQHLHMASQLLEDNKLVVYDHTNLNNSREMLSAPLPPSDPNATAYILFTSGSTGTPKGVVVPHSAICSSMAAHAKAMSITSSTRSFQFANYTFDAAICEIFTVLRMGGCVCVPTEEEKFNAIGSSMERMHVNWAFFTPTVISLLEPAHVPSLRTLVLGGEAVTRDNINVWGETLNLINGYGPTETCVFCVSTPLSRETPVGTIGYSIGSRVWVVEPQNQDQLVPIGCVGELLIEGPILSAGYLHSRDQTEKVFISDTFWSKGQQALAGKASPRRFYKTGDLVRQDVDGSLTMIGRKDSQIKVNGQRLELGEIEKHAQVCARSAQVWVDLVGLNGVIDKQSIVAFVHAERVATHTEPSDLIRGLDSSLKNTLPLYMIPSAYIRLGSVPLSSAGKIDRKQLRELAASLPKHELYRFQQGNCGIKSPRTELTASEDKLRQLWCEVLHVDKDEIQADDNFFGLGGDSVLAMRFAALARSEGISLTVSDIFKNPTLSQMSAAIPRQADCSAAAEDVAAFSLLSSDNDIKDLINEASLACCLPLDLIEDIYPCTPLQEGLMALSVRSPGSYINQHVERIPLGVDIERLKAAWESVYASDDVLRSRIIQTKSQKTIQVVFGTRLQWADCANLQAYLQGDLSQQIGYGDAMVRLACSVPTTMQRDVFLVMTAHHACFDAWSLQNLLSRVQQSYEGVSVPPPVPFKHFVKYLMQVDEEEQQKYWGEQLLGAKATQWPMQPSEGYQPLDDKTLTLDVQVRRREKSPITFSTILRAAWSIVLSKHSDSRDVVFGASLTGRNGGAPAAAGPTITTVPLRIKTDTGSVSGFLQQTQDKATQMIPFEHTGLQNIRQISHAAADACGFQTLLLIQPASTYDSCVTLPITEVVDRRGTLTFALSMICEMQRGGVRLKAVFDSRCIHPVQMQRVLHHMEIVIHQLCLESSTMPISDVDLLSSKDKAELRAWNHVFPPVSEDLIHDRLARAYEGQTNDLAVDAWDGGMTYHQLRTLTSKLALNLSNCGVTTGSLVLLCFEKSKWYIVAMLAVMECGAAFVPVDPSQPIERMRMIIESTEAATLLCSSTNFNLCQDIARGCVQEISIRVVCEKVQKLPQPKSGNFCPHVVSSSLLYVMFTSGSTGVPKGVLIEHGALATALEAQQKILRFNPRTRVLQFASHTFDVSILEILGTLTTGGCICIPNESDRLNDLGGYIRKNDVDYSILTPSVAQTLSPEEVPQLSTLVLAGESWGPGLLNQWAGHARMLNAYGPTEASILSAISEVEPSTYRQNNIGQGVGAATWITDPYDHHKLMPIGCPGELLLGGNTLARGYLKDESKTQQAFVATPSWMTESLLGSPLPDRLYRTGDLVRYNHDGSLTYLGRKDSQIKINGQRLELGDVENNISQEASVKAALAVFPSTGVMEGQLVAVLEMQSQPLSPAKQTTGLNALDSLRKAAAASRCKEMLGKVSSRLADWMIPTRWLLVEKLPILPSGKIARAMVASWAAGLTAEQVKQFAAFDNIEAFNAPTTAFETAIRDVWSDVLNTPKKVISTTASFTSLGGDSISAMQVVSRCRTQNIAVSVRDILEQRTIARVAALAKEIGEDIPKYHLFKYKEGDAFPLSPIQRFFFRLSPAGENHFNQSFALKGRDVLSLDQLREALAVIVQRHSMLRARFRQVGSGWDQFISSDTTGSFRLQAHLNTDEDDMVLQMRQSEGSLNIGSGPLLSVDLFQYSDVSPIIFLVIHHLVVDLVSWRIILQDLEDILTTGQITSQETLNFQAWTSLQADCMAKSDTHSSLPKADDRINSYWNIVEMPNVNADAKISTFELERNETAALLGDANHAFGTESIELFIACLIHSFVKVFDDRPAPTVFNESHGREPWDSQLDVTRTVGWFTTMYPIVGSARASQTLFDTIRQVKDTNRNSTDHGISLAASFDHKGVADEDRQAPAIEILFNYAGRFQQLEKSDGSFTAADSKLMEQVQNISPNMTRLALFEVSTQVSNDKLEFSISYDKKMRHLHQIETWVQKYAETLAQASRELPGRPAEPTMSDFKALKGSDEIEWAKLVEETLPSLRIKLTNVQDILRCLPVQQKMLRRQWEQKMLRRQWEQHRSFYSVQSYWKIQDRARSVDISRLTQAWRQLVSRHESLRSLFTNKIASNGDFHQLILRDFDVNIYHLDTAERKDAQALLSDMPALEVNIPYRMAICACDDSQTAYCRLDISHALIDHTSLNTLVKELSIVNDGVADNVSSSNTARVGPSYLTFAAQADAAKRDEQSAAYWKHYLRTARSCVFPTPTYQPQETLHTVSIPLANPSHLQAFCMSKSISLFNILSASWSLLLQVYTQSTSVMFGYLCSARNVPVPDVSRIVGPLINVAVMSQAPAPETTVDEFLQRFREDLASSLPHAQAADEAVSLIEKERGEDLFDTLINYRPRSKGNCGILKEEREEWNDEEHDLEITLVGGIDPMHVRYPTSSLYNLEANLR